MTMTMVMTKPPPLPPVERPDNEHVLFGRLMDDVAADADADWGFLVVRTAYATVDDERVDAQQWSRALARLRRLAARGKGEDDDVAALATPVLVSPATLQDAGASDVRRAFAAWRTRYSAEGRRRKKKTSPGPVDQNDDGDDDDGNENDDGWPAAVRSDCCLVVDASALASLLRNDNDNDNDEDAWVLVIDARDPRTVGYGGGGGPFAGWMRASARALGPLADDLEAGLGFAEDLCPPRAYLGQVPLYDGGWPAVRLIDPPRTPNDDDGVRGNGAGDYYRFPGGPGGTVRGAAQADVLLARILRDVGERVYE